MLVSLPASLSKITLPDFHQIAIDTGFIVRESAKMVATKFVQSIVSAAISGRGSYNQIAAELGVRTGDPMSRQAMEERFGKDACVSFMTASHEAILKAQLAPVAEAAKDGPVKRIIVEDSAGQAMPKANSETFPAHGNHHGATAGVKVDFAFDILANTVTTHSLHGATEQDKSIGKEAVISLQKNDLSLRDMGYFSLSEFTYIEGVGAYWLTRLPLNVGVCLENGTEIEKHLKNATGNVVDLTVLAGAEQKKCRLVAIRADKQVAGKRRRVRREEAKKCGKTASQKALIRDGWHIMLTNLSSDEFAAKDLAAIYRIRWGVEIQFRAWKQSTNMGAMLNRKSKENHITVLMLGAMIAHLLGMMIGRIFATKIGMEKLSFEKLYDVLANHHITAECVEDIMNFQPDLRHISRDKRSRVIPFVQGVTALT
jgi:hypothetical protein